MRRMGIMRFGGIFAALLLASGLLTSCSEDGSSTFMDINSQADGVADFDNILMEGGDVIPFFFTITGEMLHPEVRATWTVLNREIFIDMYVMPAADWDPNLDPPDQPNIFWSSIPDLGPEFGDRRGTAIILHPCVFDTADPPACRPEGTWVVLFHNGQQRNPANRSLVSATVDLRYFK